MARPTTVMMFDLSSSKLAMHRVEGKDTAAGWVHPPRSVDPAEKLDAPGSLTGLPLASRCWDHGWDHRMRM